MRQDEFGPSQLGDAPPLTQPSQQPETTPVPSTRPPRQVVPPSPLTYSAAHVRAGRKKTSKPGTVRGIAPKRGRH